MAYRDRTIGELNPDASGQRVQLAGWVASRRDHGGMVFFNLRDRWDQVQVVVRPDAPELMARAAGLKLETVVSVTGTVRTRPDGLAIGGHQRLGKPLL